MEQADFSKLVLQVLSASDEDLRVIETQINCIDTIIIQKKKLSLASMIMQSSNEDSPKAEVMLKKTRTYTSSKRNLYTQEQKDYAKELLSEGKGTREVAALTGIEYTSISKMRSRLKKAGLINAQ